jgi:Fe2+ or Zn2+ uptake regulation protein
LFLTTVADKVPGVKDVEELTARFRAHGLRVTPQRQAVFRLLAGNDTHPTVESIHAGVRAEMPTVSLRTVYQTVHDLARLGEVHVLDVGTGQVRVDPNVEEAHHHLVCTRCGRIEDVAVEAPAPPAVPGFRAERVEVIFRGTCADCEAATAGAPAPGSGR